MAKAQGIIGNFKGKIGNTVGYQLTSSNNKQTQGIRIYQPNVKNPKTSAQAEQRAKLAPINATYRALKMVIDRGNEGLPYGNKSRLAWLKKAFKAQTMPWFVKGAQINVPVLSELTKGSLPIAFPVSNDDSVVSIHSDTLVDTMTKIGEVSTVLINENPALQEGDQLTFVGVGSLGGSLACEVVSFVVNKTSTDNLPVGLEVEQGKLILTTSFDTDMAGAIIVSREGSDGSHLRNTTVLSALSEYITSVTQDEAKTAAIESYMASGAANTDWAEESIG